MLPNNLLGGAMTLCDRNSGYIDRTGRVVIPGSYDHVSFCSEGWAAVGTGALLCRSRYGYIDVNGRALTPLLFTSAFFFQAEDGIRDLTVTGVQTCALPI